MRILDTKNLRRNIRTYSRARTHRQAGMNTFILHKIHQKTLFNKITQWFHTLVDGKEHEGTPAETIMEMSDLFIDLIKSKRLNLGMPDQAFRRNICSALCTMKLYNDVNIYKKTDNIYPSEWTAEMEDMWQELLNEPRFMNWRAFWTRVPRRAWEEALPDWRTGMEYILLSYIRRDIEILIRAKLIIEDEQGDYVDTNFYDYTEDRWDNW